MPDSLAILHCMRAPLGGLLRHVCDLAEGQSAQGHKVGIVCDATPASKHTEERLSRLADTLALGVHRVDIPRLPGPGDWIGVQRTRAVADRVKPDVLHGHGAKGGAYARLLKRQTGRRGHLPIRAYTPHGGSLHYAAGSPIGMIYMSLERWLMERSDLLLFESEYSRNVYEQALGRAPAPMLVVHNGIGREELTAVEPAHNASDILFIGELRDLKGVDVLIEAIALCTAAGQRLTATIVGSGPDSDRYKKLTDDRALSDAIRFTGAMPVREAFTLGRVATVPSRKESLPYIVLELAAAGIPMAASDVGGIGEIFGPQKDRLLPAGDAQALATALAELVAHPIEAQARARRLKERVADQFSQDRMVEGVLNAYEQALATAVKPS
ncbi:MAG: glycosyltransferase family 4 protein [Rhodobiaceae bacterium]|nr:glycosyltransferase family 4 protein [Rhodobiaceae bacterium]